MSREKREDERISKMVRLAKARGLLSDKRLPPLTEEDGKKLREYIDNEIKRKRDAEKSEDFAELYW